MQRVCFLLKVKEGLLDEYRRAHEPVWPEMLQAMRDAGIRNYSMFCRPDGLLVGYFEAEDPPTSLRRLGAPEGNRRLQARMARFFEAGTGDLQAGGPQWLQMYFHMA